MPVVLLCRSAKVGDELLREVVAKLPAIVAEHLTVPENHLTELTPADISIRVQDSQFNVVEGDLDVLIIATKFEARILTGQLRTDDMAAAVQGLLPPGMKGFVWVTLVDAFFSAFH